MESFWNVLFRDVGIAGAFLLVTTAAVKIFAKRWIEGKVDSRFNEKLETHKHELNLLTERAKYVYSRSLVDVNHYSGRKDAAAAEVYKLFRQAHGALLNLKSMQPQLTYEEFNQHDLMLEMDRYAVPKGMQEQIVNTLRTDRPMAISDLKNYLRMTAVHRAENKLNDARNAAYSNELYFSDPVIEALNRLVDACNAWLYSVYYPSGGGPDLTPPPTRKQMHDAMGVLHSTLRSYLDEGTPSPATKELSRTVPPIPASAIPSG